MHIAIEGLDGVGKTTTAKKLAEAIHGQYYPKAFHQMIDFSGKYDNFTMMNECIKTTKYKSSYGFRTSFFYDKSNNVNVVTERYFGTNYAANPSPVRNIETKNAIEVLGKPDITIVLYCDPKTNYERMYKRDPNDKDFYKLEKHEKFYIDIEYVLKEMNSTYFFINTTCMSINEVIDKCLDTYNMYKQNQQSAYNLHEYTACVEDNDEYIKWNKYMGSNVTKIKISDECKEIGYAAFMNCRYLTEIEFGKSIQNIGRSAFIGCTSLKKIINHSDYFICYNDSTLLRDDKIILHKGIDEIYNTDSYLILATWSFADNCYIRKVLCPKIKIIESYAFTNSSIEEIILDDIEEIHDRAFWKCVYLRKIQFKNKIPPVIWKDIFYGVDHIIEIVVPCESLSLYKELFCDYEGEVYFTGV